MHEIARSSLSTHELIDEFRSVLENYDYATPVETQAVVALSGFPDKLSDGRVREYSRENIARVWFSVQLCRDIAARRQGVSLEDANLLMGPRLVLNGETEQLPAMESIAIRRFGFPVEMIDEVDCGRRGVGNTKTQMEVMKIDPRFADLTDLTFVTSAYHKPRVDRTADKVLSKEIDIRTVPVPYQVFKFDIFRKVRGEIKRILSYSQKGDISLIPSRRVR